jgi:hypothetical protein
MRKEAVVSGYELIARPFFLGENEGNHSIRLLGVLAEIRTGDFPSTSYRITARGKLLHVEKYVFLSFIMFLPQYPAQMLSAHAESVLS